MRLLYLPRPTIHVPFLVSLLFLLIDFLSGPCRITSMESLLSDSDSLPPWLLDAGAVRGDLESSFQHQSLSELVQYYEDEGFDEDGHLSFNTKEVRARLWKIWER